MGHLLHIIPGKQTISRELNVKNKTSKFKLNIMMTSWQHMFLNDIATWLTLKIRKFA